MIGVGGGDFILGRVIPDPVPARPVGTRRRGPSRPEPTLACSSRLCRGPRCHVQLRLLSRLVAAVPVSSPPLLLGGAR